MTFCKRRLFKLALIFFFIVGTRNTCSIPYIKSYSFIVGIYVSHYKSGNYDYERINMRLIGIGDGVEKEIRNVF